MAILNKDDFMSRLQGLIGDDNSDDNLSLLEDFTDTYNDLEARTTDSENWKTKYEENDKMWRDKYTSRFFDGDGTNPTQIKNDQQEDIINDGEEKDFDDLFIEREG